ncbi:hypothetical protein ACFL5O_10120 [Myxococcota bacterium]
MSIAYSRTALFDGIIVAFGVAGLVSVFFGRTLWHVLFPGVCIGRALSLKLCGLAFVPAALVACVANRHLHGWTPLLALCLPLVFYAQYAYGLHITGRPASIAAVLKDNRDRVRHRLSFTEVATTELARWVESGDEPGVYRLSACCSRLSVTCSREIVSRGKVRTCQGQAGRHVRADMLRCDGSQRRRQRHIEQRLARQTTTLWIGVLDRDGQGTGGHRARVQLEREGRARRNRQAVHVERRAPCYIRRGDGCTSDRHGKARPIHDQEAGPRDGHRVKPRVVADSGRRGRDQGKRWRCRDHDTVRDRTAGRRGVLHLKPGVACGECVLGDGNVQGGAALHREAADGQSGAVLQGIHHDRGAVRGHAGQLVAHLEEVGASDGDRAAAVVGADQGRLGLGNGRAMDHGQEAALQVEAARRVRVGDGHVRRPGWNQRLGQGHGQPRATLHCEPIDGERFTVVGHDGVGVHHHRVEHHRRHDSIHSEEITAADLDCAFAFVDANQRGQYVGHSRGRHDGKRGGVRRAAARRIRIGDHDLGRPRLDRAFRNRDVERSATLDLVPQSRQALAGVRGIHRDVDAAHGHRRVVPINGEEILAHHHQAALALSHADQRRLQVIDDRRRHHAQIDSLLASAGGRLGVPGDEPGVARLDRILGQRDRPTLAALGADASVDDIGAVADLGDGKGVVDPGDRELAGGSRDRQQVRTVQGDGALALGQTDDTGRGRVQRRFLDHCQNSGSRHGAGVRIRHQEIPDARGELAHGAVGQVNRLVHGQPELGLALPGQESEVGRGVRIAAEDDRRPVAWVASELKRSLERDGRQCDPGTVGNIDRNRGEPIACDRDLGRQLRATDNARSHRQAICPGCPVVGNRRTGTGNLLGARR